MKKILVSIALAFSLTLGLAAEPAKGLKVGDDAPEFRIKDKAGKEIDLAKLSAKGPVLVRLTCGCLGCDKELPYFQAIHEAYKKRGLISIAVFAEPDKKFAKYVKKKKLKMQYALDPGSLRYEDDAEQLPHRQGRQGSRNQQGLRPKRLAPRQPR